jgi:pyruvate,orthophosphate dikinase
MIACKKKRIDARPEIMIPLVGTAEELRILRAVTEQTIAAVKEKAGYKPDLDIPIGTMIEIPRACLTATDVAKHADFFSFGTNDLTQMTYGYSRDDIGGFLPDYRERGVLPEDPFECLDQTGVGQLVKLGVKSGRRRKKALKVGVCGEHGGDPDSIDFCHRVGLDYVSCSPFRVPVARLAAAQATIQNNK